MLLKVVSHKKLYEISTLWIEVIVAFGFNYGKTEDEIKNVKKNG